MFLKSVYGFLLTSLFSSLAIAGPIKDSGAVSEKYLFTSKNGSEIFCDGSAAILALKAAVQQKGELYLSFNNKGATVEFKDSSVVTISLNGCLYTEAR